MLQGAAVSLCSFNILRPTLTLVSSLIEEYLNQPWVRSELGVSPSFGNFSGSSRGVNTGFWAAGDPLHLNQLYVSELLAHGVRVLIYAGTYDWIANWVGNERWTLEMEWPGREGFRAQPLEDWKVNQDAEPAGKFRTFGNFSFATIYGAGHLVSFSVSWFNNF